MWGTVRMMRHPSSSISRRLISCRERMKRFPLIAGLFSLVIPGLGQIYCGKGTRGGAILAAATIIGALNILFVPLFTMANPESGGGWAYWIPRIGHDLLSVWSIAFWIWTIADAVRLARTG